MSDTNEYDLDFVDDEDVEDNETDPITDQADIDCFSNLISSSNCTVRVYSDEISEESIGVLKDFPGADVQIISLPEVKSINNRSCEILNNEESSSYAIVFVKYSVATLLNKEYGVSIDTDSVMSEGELENEASKIIEGGDDEPADIT